MAFSYKYMSPKEIHVYAEDGLNDFFWSGFQKAIRNKTMETTTIHKVISKEGEPIRKEKVFVFKWRGRK